MENSIQIQTKPVSFDGTPATFYVGDSVGSYMVGVSYFSMVIEGGDAREIYTISFDVSTDFNNGVITATPHAKFTGKGGKTLSSKSTVTLTCLVLPSSNTNADIIPAVLISSGYQSPSKSSYYPLTSCEAVLTGWNISYGSDPQNVSTYEMAAGINMMKSGSYSSSVSLVSKAGITNNAHVAQTAQVSGAVVCINDTDQVNFLMASEVRAQLSTNVAVPFPKPVSAAGAFIQDFTVSYGIEKNHKVLSISGGTQSVIIASGKVSLSEAEARMTDGSNKQDNTRSWVRMVVFGVP